MATARPPSALWPPSSQSSLPGRQQARQLALRQPLHARRPFRLRDRLEYRRRKLQRRQRAQRRDGDARILELMPSRQPRRRQIEQAGVVLIDQPAALLGRGPVLAGDPDRRAGARRRALDHRQRLARLRRDDRRHVALEDAGLLGRDLRDAVAEIVGVVERDRRDHGRERRSTTLVASSRPPSPTSSSSTSAGWRANSSSPAAVVISNTVIGAPALARSHSSNAARELLVRDQRALARRAEPEALVETHEMRRGVDMHAQARRLEDRAHERDGRALAVGAGDMDHRRQLALRMPERSQQPPHPIEREIDQLGMQRQQPRDDGIDRIDMCRASIPDHRERADDAHALAGAVRSSLCGSVATAAQRRRRARPAPW